MVILTVGHSNRSLETLVELLLAHGVCQLVDIRSFPRSRHNPHFNSDTFPAHLAAEGIVYHHQKGLGGLRKPQPDSPNQGLQSEGFRAYADYMLQGAFDRELEQLLARAANRPTSLMCAEALPWRCHRSLLADVLTVRGVTANHILDSERLQPHALTPWAMVDGCRIAYPFTLLS